jgi:hypothetical protein
VVDHTVKDQIIGFLVNKTIFFVKYHYQPLIHFQLARTSKTIF